MSFNVRDFTREDYSTLEQWFKQWGWDSWQLDMISPYSYIVEYRGKPVAFTSFYKFEGVPAGNMGFTISDKDASKHTVGKAVSKGLDHVFAEAERIGLKGLQYATDKESKVMVDFFVKKGGEITDNGDAYIAIKSFNGHNNDFYYEGKK